MGCGAFRRFQHEPLNPRTAESSRNMPPSIACIASGGVCLFQRTGCWCGIGAGQFLRHNRGVRSHRSPRATTGIITGTVLDERGQPLDGVVVSAMGGSTSFAVSDRAGQFTLRSLTPGPYLVRAHLEGYFPARSTMVNVRPAARDDVDFHAAAGRATPVSRALPPPVSAAPRAPPRPERDRARRQRDRLAAAPSEALGPEGRGDAGGNTRLTPDDWFLTDSFAAARPRRRIVGARRRRLSSRTRRSRDRSTC